MHFHEPYATLGYLAMGIGTLCASVIARMIIHEIRQRRGTDQRTQTRTRLQRARQQTACTCTMRVTRVGSNTTRIIACMQEHLDINAGTLKRKLGSELPVIISADVPIEEAQKLQEKLLEHDTRIEIYPHR